MGKVIQMLEEMSFKAKEEKNAEAVNYAKFTTFSKQERASLQANIDKDSQSVEQLGASIVKAESDAKSLAQEVSDLNALEAKSDTELKAATAQRAKDNKAFLKEQQDYSESIGALERAIGVMNKRDFDIKGTSLLQLSRDSKLPAQAQAMVAAFLSDVSANDDAYAPPEAHAYEFQSGGIIELLKKLKLEFEDKRGTLEKEEQNSSHAFEMIKADLEKTIKNSQIEASEKTKQKEQRTESAALDKKVLAGTQKSKAMTVNQLKDLVQETQEKALSFEEKQALRDDEIEAIAKAIEILSSPDAADASAKHLVHLQMPASFVQLRGTSEEAMSPRHRVRQFLEQAGVRLKSKDISLLAQKIGDDPFAKVKKLIDGMINRLMEEANADAEHEGYCDKEMGKSKLTRNRLTEEIDSLTAAQEEGKANIAMLTQRIATLSKEVKELQQAMADATELRSGEKKKNAQTIEEAQKAQKAVSSALAVLEEFYKRAAQATAFVQTSSKRATRPVKMGSEEWDSLANPDFKGTVDWGHKAGMQTQGGGRGDPGGEAYTGQQEAAGGVLALLNVCLSDFNALEADTKASEKEAQTEYDKFMTDSKRGTATRMQAIEMREADQAAASSKLSEDTADLKRTQDELLAAERYHKELVPQCIDQGMTWEEVQAARQAEITSLKEALEIFSRDDIA